ncbi:MAG: bacillithiol biosynthesis cysteine-adding enzyme BshC [Bacteroidota bacterium]|jgi:bacillithiol biosynthesis cysteine-adding enzyme BshC|nr:bacillithiol biosynthesis cysteine-adding enzyme BshC [Bacteroidota bacterium]
MPYKKSQIDLSLTGQFSQLFIDYVNADPKLKSFYSFTPDLLSFKDAIASNKRVQTTDRKLLHDVLSDQYNRINAESSDVKKTKSNIDLLLDENTFTVCTGHQLCLFTGPLYFIYKILSTITLSEKLKEKYPEYNFVPVYWMASEDHDFEEIKSIHLFGKTLNWDNPSAKGAVGRLSTSSLNGIINELSGILGESSNAKELISLFENAYLKHDTLADATRFLVHELFGSYGLVIIDPDDRRLKAGFIDIIRDDISNQTNFKLVNDTISSLSKIGVKAQVNPREINVFRLTDDRTRIESASTEVLELPEEDYSPNVVLRPLYQQKILPNIAYVGGPGEIAYWLEYKAMFEHHRIMFPVLVPRDFILITDEKTTQQIDKLGLELMDLFKETEHLVKEYVAKHSSAEISLKDQEEGIIKVYNEIIGKVTGVDQTLRGSVEAELQKTLSSLKNIGSKLLRAEKQKQETSINQIKKLKDKFLPEGTLQERYENFSSFYLKYGKQFISEVKVAADPLEIEMKILELS